MPSEGSLTKSVASGVFWKLLERLLSQGTSFVVSIVLARILNPSDYGIISIVTVFTAIANVFVTSGFSTSLIQKRDADQIDFSSIFWCTIVVSCVIYFFLFLLAPYISSFYGLCELTPIIRMYSIILFIGAFNSIQSAYVSRHMQFRLFFVSTLLGTFGSGLIGIAMALNGFGVWSLVAQSVSNSLINTIILFALIPWRPQFIFSGHAAKSLMDYGWKILASDLLGTIYNNVRTMLVGKFYTVSDLAFYTRGQTFPDLICTNVSTALSSVLFPALSIISDDLLAVKSALRKSLKAISFVIFPIMTGLIVSAKPLVEVLLTSKWLGCVVYIQIIAVARALDIIPSQNLQVLRATGRSDVALKMELIKKPVSFVIILVSCFISIRAVAVSWVLCSLVEVIVDIHASRQVIGYGYRQQLFDLYPAFLLSLAMAFVMYIVSIFNLQPVVQLVLEWILGMAAYVLLAVVFKVKVVREVVNVLKSIIKK